ncbi:SUMO-specific isopeptidase USPL1 [Conger conger]|uniref:SUMO-specific isopeptidase USPL1 n=1 Tax=Conger conger TaxID=82655 RepID=UPI002A5ADD83|nr:SUMO-specific isopeptidase USPL1 [Conger conger]
MVMFSPWQRTPLDPGIPSDLPMNGESTDLGASAPSPAGYLGKVNERASQVENCPWCSAKGRTYSLRSYRINFHESITLCTNPECLFPLVSKPLEEILDSLTPGDCRDGGKRRSPSGEDAVAGSKRYKADDPAGVGLAHGVDLGLSGGVSPEMVHHGNGEHTGAAVPLQGEGSTHNTDLDMGDLPLQKPTDPLGDRDEMGSGNGEEIVPLSDGLPAVVEDVRPTVEQVVPLPKDRVLMGTSNEPEVRPVVESGVGPTVELEVRPTVELEVRPTVEPEVRPTVEPEVRPMVEPEVSLPEGQAVRLETEIAEDFPMEELEERLTEEMEVGLPVQEEVKPIVEPKAIPEEQENLTEELEIGPTVELEVRPTVELEVRPTVEPVLRPMVEQEGGPVEMVAAPSHLFWKNENNLCWLDALLVALVHCRTLRKRAESLLKNRSPIQRLCNRYSQACDLVKANEQMGPEDKIVGVPSAVLNQALKELEELRMSTFTSLQPKLKCNLGQEETPVFALPALLRLDSQAEALFQHTFHWDFECSVCGHTSRSRCQKTLSTFTGVLPDWHPLSAVHLASCNQCLRRLQRRTMVLKSISSVFALHFVEGLPQNDVDAYSFEFHGDHYFVSTIIQYDQRLKHFATWIRDVSGSWLELDDLKYPQCSSHKSLPVPGNEIHMVFWEVQPEGVGRYHSYTPVKCMGDADARESDLSLTIPQDDTFLVEALTEDSKVSPDGADSSVGSTTLLEAFEGLSHSDIVTLTLVEVDTDGNALADGTPAAALQSSPVSSSGAHSGKVCDTPKRQRGKRGMPEKAVQADGGDIGPPTSKSPPSAPDLRLPVPHPPSPVSRAPPASVFAAARWSTLLSRHPSFQANSTIPKGVSPAPAYKPALKLAPDDGLPDRAAEMFGGFRARPVATATDRLSEGGRCRRGDDSRTKNEAFRQPWLKSTCPQPGAKNNPPPSLKAAHPQTTLFGPTRTLKTQPSTALSDTGALRRKLLKKLKRKKELLAKLERVMGTEAPDWLQRPDSTETGSPYTVSSTTSLCSSVGNDDEFLHDLLSPATTASNLSPDSTGLLEMLAAGQEENPAAKQLEVGGGGGGGGGGGTDWRGPTLAENHLASAKDDFLEEFMSGAGTQPGPAAENVDFNVFDMFF